jgi:hypothetical protein
MGSRSVACWKSSTRAIAPKLASILAIGVVHTRVAVGPPIWPVGVRYGIRIIRVGAQATENLAIGGDDFWGFREMGIDAGERAGATVGAAKGAELARCEIGEEWG